MPFTAVSVKSVMTNFRNFKIYIFKKLFIFYLILQKMKCDFRPLVLISGGIWILMALQMCKIFPRGEDGHSSRRKV